MRNFILGVVVGGILLNANGSSAFAGNDIHVMAESLKSMSQTMKLIDYRLSKLGTKTN
jgi:hypothetical protein